MEYDLIVIGGGPAGSTLASLVALQGHRVLILEKYRFPRHRIGESLLPSTVHGICRLLGVDKELEAAGFVRKRGGTFLWGSSGTPWSFSFSHGQASATGYAFQVERAKFDKILLDNAVRLGVTVYQESRVTNVTVDNDTGGAVSYEDASGQVHSVEAKFVADAGGHESPFHRLAGRRVFSKYFQNVAIYAYFRNGRRLAPPNSGNILCAAFPGGWFWYIPLSNELTSVGAVVSKAAAAEALQSGKEQAFDEFVTACPLIAEYLREASRITEGMYGDVGVRSDYSYCNTAFYRNALVLIGDSACFVDPVLSSGVHLATYGALLAARSINTCLSRGIESPSRQDCFAEFEYRYRREFGKFYEFLAAFYDMHKDETSYFWAARKILNAVSSPQEAFVKLVAGLSEEDEAVSEAMSLPDPSHGGLDEWVNKRISQRSAMEGSGTAKYQPEIHGFEFDAFMPGLSVEMAQIHSQALLGDRRASESPLTAGGLIPSPDGLMWSTPRRFSKPAP